MQRTSLLQAGRWEGFLIRIYLWGFWVPWHRPGVCAGPVARGTQDFAPFGAAAPDGQAGSWPGTCM